MKYKLTLIAAFISFSIGVTAQTTDKPLVKENEKVYTSVQIQAEFPGGITSWGKYLQRKLNNSLPAENGAPPGKYTVTVDFIVSDDGTISDVVAENNPGYGTAEEAIRVIKSGPSWKPAIQNGHNVNYRVRQAITFVVNRNDSIPPETNRKDTSTLVVKDTAKNDYDKVFTSVQIEAEFPGGMHAWAKYLERNLNNSIPQSKGAPDGNYTVTLNFLVNMDGAISDVHVENDPGYGTAQEAIRVIKKGPNWKPAVQNGHNVTYRASQVITFVVSR